MIVSAALPLGVSKEREAIRQRWLASRERARERYAKVVDVLVKDVEALLNGRNADGPRAGVWGGESEWHFRETGEKALMLAVAASLPDSRYAEDGRLVEAVATALDYLARTDRNGQWHTSDTNVSRFCLAPAAEAFITLSDRLPEARFEDWVAMFRRAGAYQMKTFLPRTNWGNGRYPNMDAYFVLSTSLSAVICDEPSWIEACRGVTTRLQEFCLMPDGAYEYVDGWNPVPVYQDIIPTILGRYWLLTADPKAEEQLRATVEYYPWYSEVSGACDNGITPFIKHYWGYDGAFAAAEFTTFLTGDGRNRTVADLRLARTGDGYWAALSAQWLSAVEPAPLPTDFVREASEIHGFQMRTEGRFTAWLTGRSSAHDTLLSIVASERGEEGLERQALAAFLTEVEGKPEAPETGAVVRLIFADSDKESKMRQEVRVPVPYGVEQVEQTFEVQQGAQQVRCDLFMFFRPGTVVWDDVSLVGPDGKELLPNGGFEQVEKGRPARWSPGGYGTKGEMAYLTDGPFGSAAVRCHSPSAKDRAAWTCTVPVTAAGAYTFRAKVQTSDLPKAEAKKPLVYYLTDMEPKVTQAFAEGLAVQHLRSGLHAMGNGVRYPTKVDGSWNWSCWNGGSPQTAPWEVAQTWVFTPGRVFGMLYLVCTRAGDGESISFRPEFYPNVAPEMVDEDGSVTVRVPRIGMRLWPGEGLEATVGDLYHTLRIDGPADEVTVYAGDADFPLEPMRILCGGKEVAQLAAEKGEMAQATFKPVLKDGALMLDFAPSKGQHWKLAGVRIRHAGQERLFDVGKGAAEPGYERLDGNKYTPERGFGWDWDLRKQERARKSAKGLVRTCITAPVPPRSFLLAGPSGPWQEGQRLTLNVAIGPDEPPALGDWGFVDLSAGLRGWWQRNGQQVEAVIVNETGRGFAGDVPLPFAPKARLESVVSGPMVQVAGGVVRGLELAAGGLLVVRLRE
jgi:hypothetical protein